MSGNAIPVIAIIGILVSVLAVYLDGKVAPGSRTTSNMADRSETLRWAVELATSSDPQQAQLGIRTLSQLAESAVTAQELEQIDAALSAVLAGPSEDLDDVTMREEDYPNVRFVNTWGAPRTRRPTDKDEAFDLPSTLMARTNEEAD